MAKNYPVTPDGRYFVVKGRLWRRTNPSVAEPERKELTTALMRARREVGAALKSKDASALASARSRVDQAKIALGERGPVWWSDGAPDYNRHMAINTPYADWHRDLEAMDGAACHGAGAVGGDLNKVGP